MNDFDAYQEFTRTTALYAGALSGSSGAKTYCTLGLSGEAGEVAEKIKKIVRSGGLVALEHVDATTKLQFQKELGDVVWYVARLADEFGISLSEVMRTNQEKLTSRKDRGVLDGSGDNR